MTDNAARRRTNPFNPTDERTSDPVPDGEDIIARDQKRREATPRRYDEEEGEKVMPSDDSTLKTKI